MELADRQYQAVFPEFKEHQEQKAFSLLKSCDRLMNQALQKRNTQRVSSLLKRRERLNDLIVSRNMPLVFYAAKDFPVTGSEWGRILSEASIGLIHCVDLFSISSIPEFKQYALRRIRLTILNYLLQHQEDIKIASPVVRLMLKLERWMDDYYTDRKTEPHLKYIDEWIITECGSLDILKELGEDIYQMFNHTDNREKSIVFECSVVKIICDTLMILNEKYHGFFILSLGILQDNDRMIGEYIKEFDIAYEDVDAQKAAIISDIKTEIKKSISCQ